MGDSFFKTTRLVVFEVVIFSMSETPILMQQNSFTFARHFKDVVHGDLALRDEWFAFRDRAYAALACEWLKTEGIEPEWIDPRRRA